MTSWQPIPMSGKAARTKNQIRAVVESVLAGRDTTDLLDLSLGDPTAFGLTAFFKSRAKSRTFRFRPLLSSSNARHRVIQTARASFVFSLTFGLGW